MRRFVALSLVTAIAATLVAPPRSSISASAPAPEETPIPVAPSAPAVADRMDAYFAAQRSPAAFRALSRRGDPHIPEFSWWNMQITDPAYGNERRLKAWLLDIAEKPQDLPGAAAFNCRLQYAVKVLGERLRMLGSNHPYVAQWLRVQRVVMDSCGLHPDNPPPTFPPPLPIADAALKHLQEADRAYQAAALLFYRGNLPAARTAFARISLGPSPHQGAAAYMVAAIDAGSEPDMLKSAPAKTALALRESWAILARPDLIDAHPLAHNLIGWLGHTVDDDATRTAQVKVTLDALEVSMRVLRTSAAARDRYANAEPDIGVLRGRPDDPAWWLDGKIPANNHAGPALVRRARHDGFAAWLLFPESPFSGHPWAPLQSGLPSHAWARLVHYPAHAPGRSRDAPAWEVLSTGFAQNYAPRGWMRVDREMAAARDGRDDGALAALPVLFYNQVRTALMYGPRPARDAQFDIALERLRAYPWKTSAHYGTVIHDSLRYLMSVGRIREARRLRDGLLNVAPEANSDTADMLLLLAEDDAHLARALRDDTSTDLLERLSSRALERLARREDLPQEERARFARVAWTRAYALGRPVPAALDDLMRALNPALTAGWRSAPGTVLPEDRSALLDVLGSPGLNILANSRVPYPADAGIPPLKLTELDLLEQSDNNWWCAWQHERYADGNEATLVSIFLGDSEFVRSSRKSERALRRGLDPLLARSALWQAADPAETTALAKIDSAPKLLSERAITWVEHPRPSDRTDGQDEALARSVRSTRYGCQRQGGHRIWSRAAFELLHRRFAQSEAANQTPYWFDCSHFYYGCLGKRDEDAEALQ
jgi:hypothetical protein